MNYVTATIAAAGTVSTKVSVPTASANFIAIETGAFTTADITFTIQGQEGSTFKPLLGIDGNEVKLTGAVANTVYKLDLSNFGGLTDMKLTASVAQASGATIYIYYK